MATTNLNKPLLDLKRWEVCSPAPVNSSAGSVTIASPCHNGYVLYVGSNSMAYVYYPKQDGWAPLQLSTTLNKNAGMGGTCSMRGKSFSAISATYNSASKFKLSTSSLTHSLVGYKIVATSGSNAGQVRTIDKFHIWTTGGFGVVDVDTPFPNPVVSGDSFIIRYPIFFVQDSNLQRLYEIDIFNSSTNVTQKAIGPTSPTGDCFLGCAPCVIGSELVQYDTGTVTSATSTTITDSTKLWNTTGVGFYKQRRLRITGGTGAGQIRTISNHVNTTLTVSTAFTVTPDTTSTYAIEPNDDHIYWHNMSGSSSQFMYRFDAELNTWTTLSGRSNNFASGTVAFFDHSFSDTVRQAMYDSPSDTTHLPCGESIYFIANASALYIYSIARDSWTELMTNGPADVSTTASVGSSYVGLGNNLYYVLGNNTYVYSFNSYTRQHVGCGYLHAIQGTAVAGTKAFIATYYDEGTAISWLYLLLNTSNLMYRMMLI